jgi:hypothetical protein
MCFFAQADSSPLALTTLACVLAGADMAIFAGGFQIRRMVSKAMGLPAGRHDGVRTFCFDDLGPSTTAFRNDYSALSYECSVAWCRMHLLTAAVCAGARAENTINTEIDVGGEEVVERLLAESARVFAQNNALVATVTDSDAFAAASADCTAWMAKWTAAALVVVGAVWAYRHQGSAGATA